MKSTYRKTLAGLLPLLLASQALAQEAPTPDTSGPSPQEQAEAAAENEEEAQAEETEEEAFDPLIFNEALGHYYARRFAPAAAGFWGYLKGGDETLENYEWAQFFLAESLRELGLWHGAVQYYYTVAKTRSRPEILPDTLSRLEEISRKRPFSESLIFEDLLYDAEFGALPPHLEHWVHYVQGLYDYRNGFLRWARFHFSQIPEESVYGLKSRYVEAVHALRKGEEEKAIGLFDSVGDSKVDAPEVKNKAHLAMARLLFDRGMYADAQKEYSQVVQTDLSFDQARLLLERAWTEYNLGNFRKALGLLHALKAPSYEQMFLPDAFVLRSLVLKDLCHFIPAKRVARAFRFTYQRTLDDLKKRKAFKDVPRIFDGAVQEGPIASRTAFLRSLRREREAIGDHDADWEDSGLDAHLRRIYDLEMREQARLWGMDFEKASEAASLELLQTEEQMNLLDYEIGLDIFRRIDAREVAARKEESLRVPYDSEYVYYEFDTEFWNDELHSYKYFISNRCVAMVGDK